MDSRPHGDPFVESPPTRQILTLEERGEDVFRGHAYSAAPRIYGGQALGQSVLAASMTVDRDRPVHSLHGSFIHPGRTDEPVDYHVERTRDGNSFSTRVVHAKQLGRTIYVANASFHKREEGLGHQTQVVTAATEPEQLPRLEAGLGDEVGSELDWLRKLRSNIGVEFRFPEEYPRLANRRGETRPPRQRAWIRADESLGDDPRVHAAGFAYCSDLFLLSAVLPPTGRHLETPGLQLASLNHTIWFHSPFRADEWQLYEQEGLWMGGGRGLSRGSLFDRNGALLATTAQEGLLRFHPPQENGERPLPG